MASGALKYKPPQQLGPYLPHGRVMGNKVEKTGRVSSGRVTMHNAKGKPTYGA